MLRGHATWEGAGKSDRFRNGITILWGEGTQQIKETTWPSGVHHESLGVGRSCNAPSLQKWSLHADLASESQPEAEGALFKVLVNGQQSLALSPNLHTHIYLLEEPAHLSQPRAGRLFRDRRLECSGT